MFKKMRILIPLILATLVLVTSWLVIGSILTPTISHSSQSFSLWFSMVFSLSFIAVLSRKLFHDFNQSDSRDFFFYLSIFPLITSLAHFIIASETKVIMFRTGPLFLYSLVVALIVWSVLALEKRMQYHFGRKLIFLTRLSQREYAALDRALINSQFSNSVLLLRELPEGLSLASLDGLIVTDENYFMNPPNLEIMDAHLQGVRVKTFKSILSVLRSRVDASELSYSAVAFSIVHQNPFLRAYQALKIILEPVLAGILMVTISPILLLIALLVKISSPGPIIFRQTRLGFRGKPFVFYKFRTMTANAEENGPQWWSPEDQRVTRIGNFLRKAHLDELPQLLNIIKGEMSFVGPRPELPQFYDRLEKEIPNFRLRTLIRPGVTGWAQVRGGYANSVETSRRKFEYDLYYMFHLSPLLDFQILVDTLNAKQNILPESSGEAIYDLNKQKQ